jgi:LPXTG-site transpeptidase (sortase) family protein
MTGMFEKIKRHAKKAALVCVLFLAIFYALFYIVNLDLGPALRPSTQSTSMQSLNLDTEIAKRLGSTTVAVENYADWTKRSGLKNADAGLDADQDKDGLPNYLEYVYGTNPLKADTDGDGFSDKQEITNGYDPDAPGDAKPIVEVAISKINVSAPMVWSKSENEKDMLADLESGVSHFYKTSAPGQDGNSIISGHSSNYIWAKGDYNHIFKDLNNLENGDTISIRSVQANGKVLTFQYKVDDKFVASDDDARIFATSDSPTLTLTTCWPIGTNLKRLIIKAELVK